MSSHITMRPVPGTVTSDGYADQQVIDIDGLVAMSQAAAQDCISHGYTIELRYWGDDPSSDDLLWGPIHPGTVFAGSDGLHFRHYVTLAHFQLNEDDGIQEELSGNYGQDEIYAGSRLLDPSGKTVSKVESNRLEGGF